MRARRGAMSRVIPRASSMSRELELFQDAPSAAMRLELRLSAATAVAPVARRRRLLSMGRKMASTLLPGVIDPADTR